MDNRIIACFNVKKCVLYSKGHNKVISEGIQNNINKLYQLTSHHKSTSVNLAQTDLYKVKLWHYRLCHINYSRLHDLAAHNMATNIPYLVVHQQICNHYKQGKQSQMSLP